MHRRWMSLPLLSSCVSAFFPIHEAQDDIAVHAKRFIPFQPHLADVVEDLVDDGKVTLDITKVPKRDNTFPVVLSNKVSAPNALPVHQDGSDFSYFCTMQFGSKNQNMYMLLDTGSANTWVMAETCTSKSCGIHNLFGKSDSTSLKTTSKTWSMAYGTGQVSGVVGSDTVSFANFSLNLGFGLATTASDDFNNYPMDGILGLGRGSTNELGTPTVMESLMTQGKIGAKVAGVHLHRASDGTKDGQITFGGIDTSKFSGSLTYIQTSSNDAWEIPVDDIYVDGNGAKFGGKSAIIDTGTSYILMPPTDAATFHKLISGSSKSGESYTIPCDTKANVQVSFAGTKFSISPKDYVGKPTSGNTCASNIIGHQAFGADEWIMGDVFLKNVYAVFDFASAKIGLAPTGSGGTSTSPSPSPSASVSASESSTATTLATSVSGSATVSPTGSTTSNTQLSSSASTTSASPSASNMGNPFDVNSGSASPAVRPSASAGSSTSNNSQQSGASIAVAQHFSAAYLLLLAFITGLMF